MSLEDFKENDINITEDTTVGELMAIFGEESVRRGISYTASLSDAERSYQESVEGADYAENYSEKMTGEQMEGKRAEEINSQWAESSKKSGLGVDDG